jgi:hypothetical protein
VSISLNRKQMPSCFVLFEIRVIVKHVTSRQKVYFDLLMDADFIDKCMSVLHLPGKPEYFSS